MRQPLLSGLRFTLALLVTCALASPAVQAAGDNDVIFANDFEDQSPNILLVIMDDVGIDQLASFGYGGLDPAIDGIRGPVEVPTLDALADGGLRFRNTWSMPECSPGRAVLFTGRYPMRHNVNQALGPDDLANSQVSQFEVTVPKLMADAGYVNGKFGKAHIGGPEHNQFEHGATTQAYGWDHFEGWTEGVPPSIDTTAGGVGAEGQYSCGFVPNTTQDPVNGADSGACYLPNDTCAVIDSTTAAGDSPGMQCLMQGGILVPNETCETPAPALDWHTLNAHYVSRMVINDADQVEVVDLADQRGRGYRATVEADRTIEWINQQNQSHRPWMATLSFSAAHTPMQPPPASLLPSGIADGFSYDCTKENNLPQLRRMYDAMIEVIDTELARVLVETGIASRDGNGDLIYDPATSNTVVVVWGDNGSFYSTVKLPFDIGRSKGSAYQTGVWVPLIVSGPMVNAPGRTVEEMVNTADLFEFFGELAGLDAHALVPRRLDSASMLPYLTNPAQESIREYNFTQGALNLQANGAINGPCVINEQQCSHTPMSKAICEDNDGVWWGHGATDPNILEGDLDACWQVNRAVYLHDPANYQDNKYEMGAVDYRAIRNADFKLVRNVFSDYDPATDSGVEITTEELYRIDQDVPVPRLDREHFDLFELGPLTVEAARNYARLYHAIETLQNTQVACPGDGNDDGRVDQEDIDNFNHIVVDGGWSGSSVYDFNMDGVTDQADLDILMANLGACPTGTP